MSASLLARGVLRNSAAMRSPMKQAIQKRQIRECRKSMALSVVGMADVLWSIQTLRTLCECRTWMSRTAVVAASRMEAAQGFLQQAQLLLVSEKGQEERLTETYVCTQL